MVNPKHNWSVLLIVAAVAVCILGLLILPQVDPGDFVLNGAKVPRITAVHSREMASSCSISKFHSLLNQTREANRSGRSQLFEESHHALFAPHALLSLRC
jgi:hypothetical protein